MARHERYQRSDDPRGGSRRHTAGAVAILAVLVIGIACGGWWLWQKANEDSSLGSHDLSEAATASKSAVTATSGTHLSDDSFSNILVLTVDDASATYPALEAAHLLVLDTTASKGTLVSLPVTMLVSAGSGEETLGQLFSADGASACVSPVATATSVSVDHVVEMNATDWDTLWGMISGGSSATELVTKATGILSSTHTDMDATSLLSYMQEVQGVGRANLSTIDATTTPEGDGVRVDTAALGLAVGTLVSDS